ncbi:MAG: hypothetical protein RI953_2724 [Pseudomonadota bacterium]|jgi:hypothetical protein
MHIARLFRRLQLCLLLLIGLISLPGCIYRLANLERMPSTNPRTLYIRPIDDNTSRAGQAPKLMGALRRLLTQDRAFILTDLETARWGLEIRILESGRSIIRVEKCDQGNEILASGAVPCGRVSAGGKLPDISAEEEVSQMSVDARAIDLQTGAVLFNLQLPNLTTGAYNIVGDGTVRASMSNAQGLHALRYMENSANAVESLANTAAARIYEQLVNLSPPSPSL